MWLINTSTFELEEFFHPVPPYAVLSHRWGKPESEVSFKEYRKGLKVNTSGYRKIVKFCTLASENGLKWAWIDTCCINKRSSADLSESINSMYAWYEDARVCFAFLGDVTSDKWRTSDWWSRGWTLQELIAPLDVIFFDRDWREISDKKNMAYDIQEMTGIPAVVLRKQASLMVWTVAQRMAWAARRKTTRIEDRAYSLLGLFKINMPMLYGEGSKAFQRLQVEILQKYPDESIFGWRQRNRTTNSVFAESPGDFERCLLMQPVYRRPTERDPDLRLENPPRVTSWGIELRANARKLWPHETIFTDGQEQRFLWALTLTVAASGYMQELPCTIVLVRCGPTPFNYRRYECHHADSERVLDSLENRYHIGEIETGRLFYLWFDRDIRA